MKCIQHLPLLSNDPYEKSLIKAFALSIAADIHPLNNLRVLTYLTEEFHVTEEQKNEWYHHWLRNGLNALEKTLNLNNLSGDFCFGDHPTLADICLVPQLYNAIRYNFNLSPYPMLTRIDANCKKLPAFVNAWPEEPAT